MDYTLNIRGRLLSLDTPQIMGVINATPDSFYADSRAQTEDEVVRRAQKMVDEGADIIDIGGFSTRPGYTDVSLPEEMKRVRAAVSSVRRALPQVVISVDTFRPEVARMAVLEGGADIINDVGWGLKGWGETDAYGMMDMARRLSVPYIMMAAQPTLRDTLLFFAEYVQQMRDMGHKDIILDPGFGFGKTLEQNYALLASLEELQVLELPLLVGISRKSMIYRQLNCKPYEALNGTTVLNTIALMKGANILRVHDVKEAVECRSLVTATMARDER